MTDTPKWNSALRAPGPKPAAPVAEPTEDAVTARRRAAAAQAEAEAAGADPGVGTRVAPDPIAHDSSTDELISSMNGAGARPARPARNTPASPSPVARAVEFATDHWYVSAPLAFVLVGLVLWTTLFAGGGAEVAAAREDQQPGAPGVSPEAGQHAGTGAAPRDTGIIIDTPMTEAGSYYLSIGADTWTGEAKDTNNGEELSLEGPTAANFKRAVTLPNGSITTGVFGRAEPDKPIYHATFHRTSLGDEQHPEETTTGTYYAIVGDHVAVQGSYTDDRNGDVVTRTYTETKPGETVPTSYSVTFAAPKQVPIPYLVGWTEPEAPPAGAEAEDAKQPAPKQKETP